MSSQRLTFNLNDRVFPDSRGNFFPALQKLCHTSPPSAGVFLWHQEDTGMETPRCRYGTGVMKIKSRHNCSGFWSWIRARITEQRPALPSNCGEFGSWIPKSCSWLLLESQKKKYLSRSFCMFTLFPPVFMGCLVFSFIILHQLFSRRQHSYLLLPSVLTSVSSRFVFFFKNITGINTGRGVKKNKFPSPPLTKNPTPASFEFWQFPPCPAYRPLPYNCVSPWQREEERCSQKSA